MFEEPVSVKNLVDLNKNIVTKNLWTYIKSKDKTTLVVQVL